MRIAAALVLLLIAIVVCGLLYMARQHPPVKSGCIGPGRASQTYCVD